MEHKFLVKKTNKNVNMRLQRLLQDHTNLIL